MDGLKDIQDLLSQPIIRTIADAAMQFLQGIANQHPQQTQNENPGISPSTQNLGSSQQTPRI
jgi:hypothetical protein